jgi:hypothetical protein
MSNDPPKQDGVINYQLRANDWTIGIEEGRQLERAARRRQRKPRLDRQIAAAEKAGKTVTSITTADGVTLTFGRSEPGKTTSDNPWDIAAAELRKGREGQ